MRNRYIQTISEDDILAAFQLAVNVLPYYQDSNKMLRVWDNIYWSMGDVNFPFRLSNEQFSSTLSEEHFRHWQSPLYPKWRTNYPIYCQQLPYIDYVIERCLESSRVTRKLASGKSDLANFWRNQSFSLSAIANFTIGLEISTLWKYKSR